MRIAITDLSKRYDASFVLKKVNCVFESGHCYGLKGPNGSGKSTFLKILSGYLSHSAGTIEYKLGDKIISRGAIAEHMMFAAPYIDLITDYNMEEALNFHQQFRPLEHKVSLKEFRAVLAYDKIKPNQQIKFYSSGMQKRLQLCLIAMTQSAVLLLDEPTSYLDEAGVSWFHDLLEKYGQGKTIIIASNDDKDFKHCEEVISIEPWSAAN